MQDKEAVGNYLSIEGASLLSSASGEVACGDGHEFHLIHFQCARAVQSRILHEQVEGMVHPL